MKQRSDHYNSAHNIVDDSAPAKMPATQSAWVVFTNQTDLAWLKILKKGFRHCFVLIHDGKQWISIDPMANYMEVVAHSVPADFDLVGWLKRRGHTVISAPMTTTINRAAPVMLFTCVEACKRVLGVHRFFVITPWRLYRYLENLQNLQNTTPKKISLKARSATMFAAMKAKFRRVFHKKLHLNQIVEGVQSWEV